MIQQSIADRHICTPSHIYCSTIHNSQEMEAISIFIHQLTNEVHMVLTQWNITHRKGSNLIIRNNINDVEDHYGK